MSQLGNLEGPQELFGFQALIHHVRRDLDTAMDRYQEQERICREIDHKSGRRWPLLAQALVHKAPGDLDIATELRREQKGICRELEVQAERRSRSGRRHTRDGKAFG